jgi:chromosomal replication initiation ATPase DnaA
MKTFRDFITECEIIEGKVEWDNPKRPLQSGLTPREKNRAKRISTGVETSHDMPSEKQLERYGKLEIAHGEQKGKKVPRNKRHKFDRFITGLTNGQANRLAGAHTRDTGNTFGTLDPKRKDFYKSLKEPKN